MKSSGDSYFSALRVTDSEKEQENIYFLYQNDEGVEGNVNFLSTITSVIPMDYNYRTIVGKNIKTSGEDITINNTQKGFDVAFEESVPGTSRILKLSGNTKSASEKEVFTQDIFTTYTSFYGNITNTSSNNFSRVILIRGNQYAILKSVKAGEKASVSKDMVKCWNHFDEENSAFGTENENTVTGNIMEYLQQTYMNTQKSKEELLVVGITSENDFKLFSDDNVLKNHDTLPLGEFAIGTNTTAYAAGKKYGIEDKMPILIAEKTGPHFAVGDTCYSWSEDVRVYNPNGKEIVAKDNSCSLKRKEDPSAAYFQCHTDITVPYEELEEISVVTKDGKHIILIKDGRFVLPGTEILNEPLKQLEN